MASTISTGASAMVAACLAAAILLPSGGVEAQHEALYPRNDVFLEPRNFYPFHNRAVRMQELRRFGPSLPDLVMYGLAGIPIWKAFQYVAPLIVSRTQTLNNKKKPKKDVVSHRRNKRDLEYVKQLLQLLLAVEKSLEDFGVTDAHCQLRSTCEIYRSGVNDIDAVSSRNFIKLVNEMRREIKNPRIEPLAKYVYEYYDEAATCGEEQCDCAAKYEKCPHSLDYCIRNKKDKISQRPEPEFYRYHK